MYIDLTETNAMKQERGSKMCMAVSAAMAFNTTPEDFINFMKDISVRYKNINTEPGFGLIEIKLFSLARNKDILIQKGDPKIWKGPGIIVVHSERHKNVLHAIYLDPENKIHDPNPDTNDGREISSYKVKEYYKIIPLAAD